MTDQARTPLFRWLMVVQLLSGGFFGLAPLLIPDLFASVSGLTGTW